MTHAQGLLILPQVQGENETKSTHMIAPRPSVYERAWEDVVLLCTFAPALGFVCGHLELLRFMNG